MIELGAGRYSARINPVGGGLAALSYDGVDLVAPQQGHVGAPGFRGAVLAPWSNRIGDGSYRFAGETHQLPINEPDRGNALHGLVLDDEWRVTNTTDAACVLELLLAPQSGYPFRVALHLQYALAADGLSVRLAATNQGENSAPYGCGFHPYVRPGATPVDDAELRFEAAEHLLTDPQRLLPTGREPVAGTAYDFAGGGPIGDRDLDDAFTGLDGDSAGHHRLRAGPVEVWWSATMPWVQVFTPPGRTSLAVEPCTSPPDAFRTGEDLVVLPPDGSYEVEWGIQVVERPYRRSTAELSPRL